MNRNMKLGEGTLSVDGYGQSYTVQDLQLRRVAELKQRLQDLRPDLFQAGVKAVKLKNDADFAVEFVRKQVHELLGGDAVVDMFKVFGDTAAADQVVKNKRK